MKDPIESSEYKATSVVDSDSDKIIAQSESNSATPTNTAPYDASAATPPTLRQDVWENVQWFGWKVFYGLEAIGETIAGVIGLDESRFQYVIDGMTEEDWQIAEEVNARRELEEVMLNSTNEAASLEGGLRNATVAERVDAAVEMNEIKPTLPIVKMSTEYLGSEVSTRHSNDTEYSTVSSVNKEGDSSL